MILRLLTLPFRLVGFAVRLVFVGAIVEVLGMGFYMQWRNEAALNALVADGVTVPEVVAFLFASPDRLLVAGVLAVVAVWMALNGGGGSGSRHNYGGDDDGFGGFGGDGGGFGGGDGGGGGE